jgi:hypothetical protein
MMRIALELSRHNQTYESLATKFFEHYVYIAHAMKTRGRANYGMWSTRDGFFYDVLTYPNGSFAKFRVRSLVGIIPLYASEVLLEEELDEFPEFKKNYLWFLHNRKDLTEPCVNQFERNGKAVYLLALMNQEQLKSVLNYIFSPDEFYSSFGVRSLSKYHEKHPFVFEGRQVGYEPAESLQKIKGGNSNWRGPIWIQTNFMLLDALSKIAATPLKEELRLGERVTDCRERVLSLFKKGPKGKRPFFGETFPYPNDPHFADHILFYEYYNPETGQGLGASHQTGWSALVAQLIQGIPNS